MSTDDELTDLDEQWEEEENEDSAADAVSPGVVDKVKPAADSKDSRRRLEALLEQQRIKREINDMF